MCGIGALWRDSDGDETFESKLGKLISALSRRGPDHVKRDDIDKDLTLVGAVLHIQGAEITEQPVSDCSGNKLLWNGEVFGGSLLLPEGSSDTSVVMNCLSSLELTSSESPNESSEKIMNILMQIQGPYAFLFYCASQGRLYFGRDPFGRRSLVFGKSTDGRIRCIASCCFSENFDWEEVPISGIFSIGVSSNSNLLSDQHHCAWPETCLRLNRPLQDLSNVKTASYDELLELSSMFHALIENSLRKRISRLSSSFSAQQTLPASSQRCFVGVLFSGGIDSLLLAAMLHVTMGALNNSPIELINIAFDFRDSQGKASAAPDRLAGIAGLFALKRLFPEREWRFVEIDVTEQQREEAEEQIKQQIKPLVTHMDLNIGTAFWFASRGEGLLKVYDSSAEEILYQQTNELDRPLLRLGEEGALRGVGRAIDSGDTNATAVAEQLHNGTGSEQAGPNTSETEQNVEEEEVERKAPHWCKMPGCKRPTKKACPGKLCGRCCEERMAHDKDYVCKTHLKGKVKKDGASAEPKSVTVEGKENEEEAAVDFDYRILPVESATSYRAQCKALLVGMGADEQLAGYGRHRTVFQRGGYSALQAELNKDLTRLWQRNLGRDDRCIADHGREAWFPYLDEDVVAFIQSQPLPHLANLQLPPGIGDKQILRQTAARLGLEKSAQLVKRAIQFGSLASKQTSVSYFGSRRKGKGTSTI